MLDTQDYVFTFEYGAIKIRHQHKANLINKLIRESPSLIQKLDSTHILGIIMKPEIVGCALRASKR